MQIFNTEADGLARTCASNRQGINQQPQLMIQYVSGGDKFVHFLIRENDVPRLLCIRQASKSDFPGFSILNTLVVMRYQHQRGTQTAAKSIDGCRRHRAKQAITPFL